MIPMPLGQVGAALGVPVAAGVREDVALRICTDSRELERGDLFFALSGPNFDGNDFVTQALARGAVGCVVSRGRFSAEEGGAARPLLVVDDTVAALGRLAHDYRRNVMSPRTVVVGVTGSNGKTTTKRMLDHVLRAELAGRASPRSFNNQIGVPLTLFSANANDQYLVTEIGTNSPGEIARLTEIAAPDVGVLTSVGEAHLEKLGSIDGVAREKMSLFHHVRSRGLAVINVDRAEVRRRLEEAAHLRCMTIGFTAHANTRARCLEHSIRHSDVEIDGRFRIRLPMPGAHHATNAAATFLVARWFGVDPETIIERLRNYVPPEGRTEVFDIGGVTVVDDTYNANPSSMSAAIQTLRDSAAARRIFVMADMLELGARSERHHQRVLRNLLDAGFDTVVCVGPLTCEALAELRGYSGRGAVETCPNTSDASRVLSNLLRPGDVVWLKGSRAMKLDRVVGDLKQGGGRRAAVA